MPRLLVVTVLAALTVATHSAGAGPAAGPTLVAIVGPDFTISLTKDGSPVTQLAPGPYTIAVDDRSDLHDFMLVGPGVDRFTDYAFVGQVTWTVTLEEGYYRFYCSPHEGTMNGEFTVGTPPAPSVSLSVDEQGAVAVDPAQLAPGRYSIGVEDRSSRYNVRLAGPGVDEHTQNHVARSSRWTVQLAEGVYHAFPDRRPAADRTLTVGSPPPPGDDTTLTAITGPDFAITLLHADSSPVTQLDPGRYTIHVEDTSAVHNFHLTGPRVDRSTTVPFVGAATWEIDLGAGAYRFFCDPHTLTMTGSFRVGSPPPPRRKLRVGVTASGALRGPSGRVAAGAYAVTVSDRSRTRNLHLRGPGVDRKTGRAFRGTVRWKLTLRGGKTYRYRSDGRRRPVRVLRAAG
jgi:plastocyanin